MLRFKSSESVFHIWHDLIRKDFRQVAVLLLGTMYLTEFEVNRVILRLGDTGSGRNLEDTKPLVILKNRSKSKYSCK